MNQNKGLQTHCSISNTVFYKLSPLPFTGIRNSDARLFLCTVASFSFFPWQVLQDLELILFLTCGLAAKIGFGYSALYHFLLLLRNVDFL